MAASSPRRTRIAAIPPSARYALGAPGIFGGAGDFGATGAPGVPALPEAPGTSGAPGAPGAPGKVCVIGRFAPQAEHISAEGSFTVPHFGHVLSDVTAAGLKHIHTFLLEQRI